MNKKCWWSYSNQCFSSCGRKCFLFYPVLKGMLEEPNFGAFEVEKLLRITTDAERKSYEKLFKKRGGTP